MFHFNCVRAFSKRKAVVFAVAAAATLLGISAAKSNAAFTLINGNSSLGSAPTC